jgi:hypothetical protein
MRTSNQVWPSLRLLGQLPGLIHARRHRDWCSAVEEVYGSFFVPVVIIGLGYTLSFVGSLQVVGKMWRSGVLYVPSSRRSGVLQSILRSP